METGSPIVVDCSPVARGALACNATAIEAAGSALVLLLAAHCSRVRPNWPELGAQLASSGGRRETKFDPQCSSRDDDPGARPEKQDIGGRPIRSEPAQDSAGDYLDA